MMSQRSSRIRSIAAFIGILSIWFALGVLFYQEGPEDTPTISVLLTTK